MLIRSQDKYSIINFDNIDRVRLSEQRKRGEIKAHYQTDVFYDTEETFGVLGTYSTEEKAIKVLDMICDSCRNMAFIDEKAVVFNMPQDSEV